VAEKNTILVVCDRLLKIAHFVTIIEETLVKESVRLFRDNCYDLKLKGLSNKTTLVLSNTRELDRVPNIK